MSPARATRGPSWHRLDGTAYDGPIVVARVAPARPRPGWPPFVECPALLDTGATHSVLDLPRVARTLGLTPVDARRMRVAGPTPVELPVVEAVVTFPGFALPARHLRVGAVDLPPAFALLIGMDLLDGTRLAMEWGPEGRWLRWERLPTPPAR